MISLFNLGSLKVADLTSRQLQEIVCYNRANQMKQEVKGEKEE